DRTFPDTLVGVVRVEQAGKVERLVVAFVEDRTLLTRGQDGGVTDLNVGIFEAHTMCVGMINSYTIGRAHIVTLTDVQDDTSRTKIARSSANELQERLNLRVPILLRTSTRAGRIDVTNAVL